MSECVIYNPAAGRGRARRIVERLRNVRSDVQLVPTAGPGRGAEHALQAIAAGHTTIVAAGGDGTVHEVACGVLEANSPDVAFGVWPIGSANDYAYALGVTGDWPILAAMAGCSTIRQVDVGRVSGGGRSAFFVNGLGLGFNSAVTLEARSIPRLSGMTLYGLAFLKAVWRRYDFLDLTVNLDDREFRQSTLALTVSLGKREGGFLVAPRADLEDGLFDIVLAGAISRWKALSLLPRLANGTLPHDHALIQQSQCRSVTVHGRDPLRVHIDGEFFCHPEDGISEIAVELLPRRLRVLAPGLSETRISRSTNEP